MGGYRPAIKARYSTPIGQTVAAIAIPKPKKEPTLYTPIPVNTDTATRPHKEKTKKSKAVLLIEWFNQLRTAKIQLNLFRAGKELRQFSPFEFEYIPRIFKEAERLIKGNKFLSMRLDALDCDIPLSQYYASKGVNRNEARREEEFEAKIVCWALRYFEKQIEEDWHDRRIDI
jgi:hypothetical protein